MSERPQIHIDPTIEGKVRLGWLVLEGVNPTRSSASFETEREALCTRLRWEYETPAAAGPRNRPARTLYRAVGLDPTKHRPSSEALLRRVLTGKQLYRVNTVVDAANLWSLGAALPVGLYDADRLAGTVRAGIGATGQGYEGIGKGRINVEGRLMLCDEVGPFGNPSADSFRTRVRDETRRVLFVLFGPAELSRAETERLAAGASELIVRHTGGIGGPVSVAP